MLVESANIFCVSGGDAMHTNIVIRIKIIWWLDECIGFVGDDIIFYRNDTNRTGRMSVIGSGFKIDGGESHDIKIKKMEATICFHFMFESCHEHRGMQLIYKQLAFVGFVL